MQYFKVPLKYDNVNVYKNGKLSACLVGNELLTEKECKKLGINPSALIPTEISRKKVCWVFGARFEIES